MIARDDGATTASTELRALAISKWGNLFMGAAGVFAAWLSNSQALMVDGLFSLIGFSAAVFGARVSAQSKLTADRRRPLGYAIDESIFLTFRALSLLGLIAFAFANGILSIVDYARGGAIETLRYGPIVIYFVVICITCVGLALAHRNAWLKTGKRSEVLRLEMQAAIFDGLITASAGIGFLIIPFLKDGPLGWITPIGDSVIAMVLCSLVVGRYYSDFMKGLSELAGVSAAPEILSRARRSMRPIIAETGGSLIDFSILKVGRGFEAHIYFDPGRAITAAEVDHLTVRINTVLSQELGQASSVVLISQHGRELDTSSAVAATDKDARDAH